MKIFLKTILLSMIFIACKAGHTFNICNMSTDRVLMGYINRTGMNKADYNFSLEPGVCREFDSNDCLKGFYYTTFNGSTTQPCAIPDYEGEGHCSYAGGGDLRSCESATYVYGAGEIGDNSIEGWAFIKGVMTGQEAVSAILECIKNKGYKLNFACGCGDPGDSCETDFVQTACLLLCWLTGQGILGKDAVDPSGWQTVDSKNEKVKAIVKKRPLHEKSKTPTPKKPVTKNPIAQPKPGAAQS